MPEKRTVANLLKRNPGKFEPLNLFDSIGREEKYTIGKSKDIEAFLDRLRQSLMTPPPTLLYGKRIEKMFGYVVATLGKCVLVKKEDEGEIYTTDNNIKCPDYRIVLDDTSRTELLIEVKNHHGKTDFCLSKTYLAELKNYASLTKCKLYIAIFWSCLKIWTLLCPSDFENKDEKSVCVSLYDAVCKNRMRLLGDYMIATIPPITIRIYPDTQSPLILDQSGYATLKIGNVEILCNGCPIQKPEEKQLAYCLAQYGTWQESNEIIMDSEIKEKVRYIDFSYKPPEQSNADGFEIIGDASSIIAMQYTEQTVENGKVKRISPHLAPDKFGVSFSENYHSDELPIWRFYIQPSE